MILKFKKLHPDAVLPGYATGGAAAFDLTAISWRYDEEGDFFEYSTGLAVEIPDGYVGLVYARSSVTKSNMFLANGVGVVDSDYRGELLCRFKEVDRNTDRDIYGSGDRVAQMMIVELPQVYIVEADELSETTRGAGGWGSTGK